MIAILITAWLVFWVGFIAGIWWSDHRSRRRIRQDLWRQTRGIYEASGPQVDGVDQYDYRRRA